jgi:hypothetical protein
MYLLMNEPSKHTPPKASAADHSHAAGRALLSAIPIGGGAAVEFFNVLITPPIEKRRQQWMTEIASAIDQLQKENAELLPRLQKDTAFHSLLLQASWAAVRNHHAEKLLALKNAVVNSARDAGPSDDLQLLFVRYVDELTPTHLVVLRFLMDHENAVANLEGLPALLSAFAATTGQQLSQEFFKLTLEDLDARVLIRLSKYIDDFADIYSPDHLLIDDEKKPEPRIRVSSIGRQFLNFITSAANP